MSNLNDLQEALEQRAKDFVEIKTWVRSLNGDTEKKWISLQDIMELFSSFKVEYDNQLHVPRFSVCMSAEDYDRLVHIPRKQLSDKVVEYKNIIEMGKAEGIDFAFLKGALSVWEELLEGSKETGSR